MSDIRRHFVTVGKRRVHYRRAGSGPAVVLLHASPCSSAVFTMQIRAFAKHFTALGFDSPGYGLSDPLPLEKPEIEDFADALDETLEALGIRHCAVYGRHTGASIAVEFGRRHPERTSFVLLDSYPAFSPTEGQDYLARYLKPFVPEWDAGHLMWLWFRYRDQHVFWPFHQHTIANRATQDVPGLDFLHRGCVEIMQAGDGYRVGYAAAFRHDGLKAVDSLKVPACFTSRKSDTLYPMLDKLPKGTWIERVPSDKREATVREVELLRTTPARGEPPLAPKPTSITGRLDDGYVTLSGRQLRIRSAGDVGGSRKPLVVLHAVPGSSALLTELLQEVGAQWPVLAIDLPGHGDSDMLGEHAIESYAGTVSAVLSDLGLKRYHLYGRGTGATVAVALALADEACAQSLILHEPMTLHEREDEELATVYAFDASPRWDGSHLTAVWHHLRDQQLWWPWFRRIESAARTNPPMVQPPWLQRQVTEVMKHPRSYEPAWRAAFRYGMRRRLTELHLPVMLASAGTDLFHHCRSMAANVLPKATICDLPDAPATGAAEFVKFLRKQP
ncbi:MAG: alpha/beta fold hydrolase [Alphaproteobacteria bacterium]|nr:alpha/beta fold hydrolase [Alphaproteobacteria bacterium]